MWNLGPGTVPTKPFTSLPCNLHHYPVRLEFLAPFCTWETWGFWMPTWRSCYDSNLDWVVSKVKLLSIKKLQQRKYTSFLQVLPVLNFLDRIFQMLDKILIWGLIIGCMGISLFNYCHHTEIHSIGITFSPPINYIFLFHT